MTQTAATKTAITLKHRSGDHRDFLIEGDAGWCRFSTFKGSQTLSSFGGIVWPGSFPDIFEHFGPDTGCITARSGYRIRSDAIAAINALEAA